MKGGDGSAATTAAIQYGVAALRNLISLSVSVSVQSEQRAVGVIVNTTLLSFTLTTLWRYMMHHGRMV